MKQELLRLCNVSVNYGTQPGLRNLNLFLHRGELLGFVASNDFEMSLFLDFMTGVRSAAQGFMLLENEHAVFYSTMDAVRSGIYYRRKESQLIYKMSTADNIFLTNNNTYKFGFQNKKLIHALTSDLMAQFGVSHLSPTLPVLYLDDFARFYVELIKLYNQRPKLLIIEAPGFDYNEEQCRLLQLFFKNCAQAGISCICAANKFLPIMRNMSQIYMLQQGTISYAFPVNEQTEQRIRSYQFRDAGRAEPAAHAWTNVRSMEWKLKAENFILSEDYPPLDFEVEAGTVLGIWDAQKRSATAFLHTICGRKPYKPVLSINGKYAQIRSRESAIEQGICIVDDGICDTAVFPNMSLSENVALLLEDKAYQIQGIVSASVRKYVSRKLLEEIDAGYLLEVCPEEEPVPEMTRKAQMDVIVARMLCTRPKVFVFVNPFNIYNDTNIERFQKILTALRNRGIASIIWSSTQKDLMQVSDAILTIAPLRPRFQHLRDHRGP